MLTDKNELKVCVCFGDRVDTRVPRLVNQWNNWGAYGAFSGLIVGIEMDLVLFGVWD